MAAATKASKDSARDILSDIRTALHVLILLQLGKDVGRLPETERDRLNQLLATLES